jgi:glycerophosphoryl diester phosphodiesterase
LEVNFSIVPPVIAHRGASAYAPENTLAAFSKAQQLGLKWVEFDVMLAASGEAVVIHDDDLGRTTNGQGNVIDSGYSYLKTLDAGSWFNPIFAKERIPLLQDVLQFLYQHQLAANLEIKPLLGDEYQTVQQVMKVLQAPSLQLVSPLLISSFSPLVLQLVRKMAPQALIGILMDEWLPEWQDFCIQMDGVSVNVNHVLLTPARVKDLKSAGYLVLAYTVNTIARAHELFSWGVDAIFSDCPPPILTELNTFKV